MLGAIGEIVKGLLGFVGDRVRKSQLRKLDRSTIRRRILVPYLRDIYNDLREYEYIKDDMRILKKINKEEKRQTSKSRMNALIRDIESVL